MGIGTAIGWWFSDSNMIVNDIICLCLIISLIKILKFTSLKLAGLTFLVIISIEIIFATVLYLVSK